MTYAIAKSKLLSELSAALPPGSTKDFLGITSFIKKELVNDGGLKPKVIPPPGGFPKRNASGRGKFIGRMFDGDFQKAVLGGKKTKKVQQALRLLRENGIVPVKCQVRVVTKSNKLTTLIDAVGMMLKYPHTPVCIELKTCQLSTKVYDGYALSSCQRTPLLACVPPLNNTERSRHHLQAGYGALALQCRLGVPIVHAVVLVMCKEGPFLYHTPVRYQNASLFRRLDPAVTLPAVVFAKPAKATLNSQSARAALQKWPAHGDLVLRRQGLRRDTKKPSSQRAWIARGRSAVVLVVCVHKWRAAPPETKQKVRKLLQSIRKHIPDDEQKKVLAAFVVGEKATDPFIPMAIMRA